MSGELESAESWRMANNYAKSDTGLMSYALLQLSIKKDIQFHIHDNTCMYAAS